MIWHPAHATILFLGVVAAALLGLAALTYFTALRLGFPKGGARRLTFDQTVAVSAWLGLTFFLAWQGILQDFQSIPPRIFLVIVPALAMVIVLTVARRTREFQLAMPVVWLIALQTFRLPLEIVLHQLGTTQPPIIPEIMTFEGRNFDILTGLTAPLMAFLVWSGRDWALRLAVWWNLLGLVLLINVVAHGILAAPTRFRVFDVEPANTFVAHPPYVWLVAFLVPLALYLHLNALRNLVQLRNKTAR